MSAGKWLADRSRLTVEADGIRYRIRRIDGRRVWLTSGLAHLPGLQEGATALRDLLLDQRAADRGEPPTEAAERARSAFVEKALNNPEILESMLENSNAMVCAGVEAVWMDTEWCDLRLVLSEEEEDLDASIVHFSRLPADTLRVLASAIQDLNNVSKAIRPFRGAARDAASDASDR